MEGDCLVLFEIKCRHFYGKFRCNIGNCLLTDTASYFRRIRSSYKQLWELHTSHTYCQDVSKLFTVNYLGRVGSKQVMDDVIILRINANQVRLLQCRLIQHNYLYDCQNFKTECRPSSLKALRERKVPKLMELFHFFGHNTYPYEEIAISCSKAVLRNIKWIMNFGMWVLLLERVCNLFGSTFISHTLQQEKKRNNT